MGIPYKIWIWAENNPLKAILIAGIFVRLLVVFLYRHVTLYPDSEDYIVLAERILSLNLSGYEGQRSPGYPLLLAIGNISHIVTCSMQLIAGTVNLLLFYRLSLSSGLSNKVSLITTLLLCCYIPAIFFEVAILTETITLLSITLIFYLFVRIRIGQSKQYILLSLTCGFLVLIKPFYVFLPLLLFLFSLSGNTSIKTVFFKSIYIAIVPVIFFLGWSYVNKVNTGHFTSTTFYGFNLAQNCVSFAENTTPEYAEIGNIYAKYRDNSVSDKEAAMTIWEAYPELEAKTGLSFPGLSEKLYDYSIATIRMNPAAYIKQAFVSWRDFWKTSLYWEYDSFAISGANDIVLYICYAERVLLQLIKILFVLLIPYNIISAIRKRRVEPQVVISIIVFTASVLQAMITYGTNSRFSFPFEMLVVLAVILNLRNIRIKNKRFI
ncbi:hypothetical protein D0T84_03560 [Dysgonomonas sp. 521]|nr:hypothetical protein [Dysgonomonas sp. 521]